MNSLITPSWIAKELAEAFARARDAAGLTTRLATDVASGTAVVVHAGLTITRKMRLGRRGSLEAARARIAKAARDLAARAIESNVVSIAELPVLSDRPNARVTSRHLGVSLRCKPARDAAGNMRVYVEMLGGRGVALKFHPLAFSSVMRALPNVPERPQVHREIS